MIELFMFLELQAMSYCNSLSILDNSACIELVKECSLNEPLYYCFNDKNLSEVLSND